MLCAVRGLCDTVWYMVYDPEDFRESMDDMCDDAIRRMKAFHEGGLVLMQPGDAYVTEILRRDTKLNNVEYSTVTRARVVDIHNDLVDGELPDFAVHLGGAAIIALAREAAFLGAGQTIIVPTPELSEDEIRTKLLVNQSLLRERSPVSMATFQLGSYGIARLVLGPTEDAWELYYESRRRAVRFLSH